MPGDILFEFLQNSVVPCKQFTAYSCSNFVRIFLEYLIFYILYVHPRGVFAMANGTVRRIGTAVRRGNPA